MLKLLYSKVKFTVYLLKHNSYTCLELWKTVESPTENLPFDELLKSCGKPWWKTLRAYSHSLLASQRSLLLLLFAPSLPQSLRTTLQQPCRNASLPQSLHTRLPQAIGETSSLRSGVSAFRFREKRIKNSFLEDARMRVIHTSQPSVNFTN